MPTIPTHRDSKPYTTLPDIFRTADGTNLDIGPHDRLRNAGGQREKIPWGRGGGRDREPELAPASYPRIVLRDSLGHELDTFTTLQEAIYRAKWKVKQSGHAETPLEWRLPKAPCPARPDLTRAFPPLKHPRVETELDKMKKRAPYSNILEFDVDDVGFVRESLQYLPYVPSLSFLRQEILCGPKVYFQIVGTMLLHERILSLTEKRNAVYKFPGFCSGCTRLGLCYGCDKSSMPHYHEDKPVKTGGGFTYFKKDRPENEIKSKNPVNWRIHNPDLALKKIMEEYGGIDLEGKIPEEIKKHLDTHGGHRETISHIPDFAAEKRRREQSQAKTTDKEQDHLPDEVVCHDTEGDHSDQELSDDDTGARSQVRFKGQNDIDLDIYDEMQEGDEHETDDDYDLDDLNLHQRHGNKQRSKVREGRSRSEENQSRRDIIDIDVGKRGSSFGRGERRYSKQSKVESDDDQLTGHETDGGKESDKSDRTSRSRKKLYKPPPSFKLKKSPTRKIEAKSPFSTDRDFNLNMGPGFQPKKSNKGTTKFKAFRNVDVSWKDDNKTSYYMEPKKFELKENTAKPTKFWNGARKKKDDDGSKKRSRKDRSPHGRGRVSSPARSISPDSGLDSELMTVVINKKPSASRRRPSKKLASGAVYSRGDWDCVEPSVQQTPLDSYSDTAAEYYRHMLDNEDRGHSSQHRRAHLTHGLPPLTRYQEGHQSRRRKAANSQGRSVFQPRSSAISPIVYERDRPRSNITVESDSDENWKQTAAEVERFYTGPYAPESEEEESEEEDDLGPPGTEQFQHQRRLPPMKVNVSKQVSKHEQRTPGEPARQRSDVSRGQYKSGQGRTRLDHLLPSRGRDSSHTFSREGTEDYTSQGDVRPWRPHHDDGRPRVPSHTEVRPRKHPHYKDKQRMPSRDEVRQQRPPGDKARSRMSSRDENSQWMPTRDEVRPMRHGREEIRVPMPRHDEDETEVSHDNRKFSRYVFVNDSTEDSDWNEEGQVYNDNDFQSHRIIKAVKKQQKPSIGVQQSPRRAIRDTDYNLDSNDETTRPQLKSKHRNRRTKQIHVRPIGAYSDGTDQENPERNYTPSRCSIMEHPREREDTFILIKVKTLDRKLQDESPTRTGSQGQRSRQREGVEPLKDEIKNLDEKVFKEENVLVRQTSAGKMFVKISRDPMGLPAAKAQHEDSKVTVDLNDKKLEEYLQMHNQFDDVKDRETNTIPQNQDYLLTNSGGKGETDKKNVKQTHSLYDRVSNMAGQVTERQSSDGQLKNNVSIDANAGSATNFQHEENGLTGGLDGAEQAEKIQTHNHLNDTEDRETNQIKQARIETIDHLKTRGGRYEEGDQNASPKHKGRNAGREEPTEKFENLRKFIDVIRGYVPEMQEDNIVQENDWYELPQDLQEEIRQHLQDVDHQQYCYDQFTQDMDNHSDKETFPKYKTRSQKHKRRQRALPEKARLESGEMNDDYEEQKHHKHRKRRRHRRRQHEADETLNEHRRDVSEFGEDTELGLSRSGTEISKGPHNTQGESLYILKSKRRKEKSMARSEKFESDLEARKQAKKKKGRGTAVEGPALTFLKDLENQQSLPDDNGRQKLQTQRAVFSKENLDQFYNTNEEGSENEREVMLNTNGSIPDNLQNDFNRIIDNSRRSVKKMQRQEEQRTDLEQTTEKTNSFCHETYGSQSDSLTSDVDSYEYRGNTRHSSVSRKTKISKRNTLKNLKQRKGQFSNTDENEEMANDDKIQPKYREQCTSPPAIPDSIDFEKCSLTSHEPELELVFNDVIDVENLEVCDDEDEKQKAEEKRRRRHRHKRRKRRAAEAAKDAEGLQEQSNSENDFRSVSEQRPSYETEKSGLPLRHNDMDSLGLAVELVAKENTPVPYDNVSRKPIFLKEYGEDSEEADSNEETDQRWMETPGRRTRSTYRSKDINKKKTSKGRTSKSDDRSQERSKSKQSRERHSRDKSSQERLVKEKNSVDRKSKIRQPKQMSKNKDGDSPKTGTLTENPGKEKSIKMKKKKVKKQIDDEQEFYTLPSIQTQIAKIMGGAVGKRDSISSVNDIVHKIYDEGRERSNEEIKECIKNIPSEKKWELVRPRSEEFGDGEHLHNEPSRSLMGMSRSRSQSMPLLSDLASLQLQMKGDILAALKHPFVSPVYLPQFRPLRPKKQFNPNPRRVQGRDRSQSIAGITNLLPFMEREDSTVKSELETLKEEPLIIPTPSPEPIKEPEPPVMDHEVLQPTTPTPLALRVPTPEKVEPPPPRRREIVKKEKKPRTPAPKPPTPREPTPSPPPPPPPPVEEPVTSRDISFVFEKEPKLPELPPIEIPALPEFQEKQPSHTKKVKKEMKLITVAPEMPEAKKKLPPPPKLAPRLKHGPMRRSKIAEAPVTSQELQQLSDPLDFLAKYCIINPDRLPFYERVFNGAVSVQTPRYSRSEGPRPGAMVSLPPAVLSQHELNMLRDLTVLSHAQSPRREGVSAPEQYLEKLNYTVEFIKGKVDNIQDHMTKLQGEKMHYMATMAREMDRDIAKVDYKVTGKKKKKKKKKKVDIVDYDKTGAMSGAAKDFKPTKTSDITDEVIVSRMNDKMMKKVKKEPVVKTLTLEISRDIEKLKHFDQRIAQIEDEKDLVGLYCMDYYFSEQAASSRPHEFRRQQSRLYQKLHPDPDIEMNVEEVELALQQINNKLLTEKEFQYIFFILDLPKREKINFRLFSIIAALSEKVTQMDPVIRKLINKADYNALDVKMEKSKELFDLLQDVDLMPMGNAPADNLAVELTAGGLTPEHTNYVLSKFDRDGRGFCDFMDFVTYVPLFIQIHKRIINDPFNDNLDV